MTSDDDVPLRSRRNTSSASIKDVVPDSGSESDQPLAQRRSTRPASAKADSSKVDKRTKDDVSSDSDSDVPLSKKVKKATPAPKKKAAAVKAEKKPTQRKRARTDDIDEEDVNAERKTKRKTASPAAPLSKTAAAKKAKEEAKAQKEQEKADKAKAEDEEEHKWWLEERDDSVKWKTLEHNGPMFPPAYVPHGVKMKYDGKLITLSAEAEEVATFFAALVGTDWGNNPTFQKNFFEDFVALLKEHDKGLGIKKFDLCDFTPITDHLAQEKEKKALLTKEEKLKIKEDKAKLDEKYGAAYLDGRKEKVGNYRIEPPGLFRGRGEHPKTGRLKTRVAPEQVTINIGEDAKVPEPPEGHKWGSITHDNTVTWLAMWKENVNESIKYVFLAATSSLKGVSDMKKFEKARALKVTQESVHSIRQDYTRELKDKIMHTRQRATAMYLIDRLALRAGNEKGDDEADTVGCCSLRYEHISLEPPNKVIFDFLGKDSIRYYNKVEVDAQVFKNLKVFKRPPKEEGHDLFDRLNTAGLNKHLATYMPGLTAKVFRTYNASHTFSEELKKTPVNGTVAEKVLAYQRANRQVAILCNHQRAVSKGHSGQIDRILAKIRALKYERMNIKKEMLALDKTLKKKRPELTEDESDIDDEFIASHEKFLEEQEEEKARKKHEKDNEKRVAEGQKPVKFVKPEKRASTMTIEKLEKKLITVADKIEAQKMLMIDKDEGKTTALGTSKINYIDPRISAAWCHKYDVPLEKVFNRTLREKFRWAMDPPKDWEF
ncbi:DNA topoisomerase 1 [Thoreauomyces humboldtii]|nr:DNA topoisomerase 1 [Thoreauomyces humboldtii]